MPLGYAPTLRQIREHYAVDGPVVNFFTRVTQGKRVQITGLPETLSANNGRNLADIGHPVTYGNALNGLLDDVMPDAQPDDVPSRYPGFHATVERDIVLEIDDKTDHRRAFGDGRRILDFLNRCDAPYRIKFSGNSSPHIVIPEAAYSSLVPDQKREEAFQGLFEWLITRCCPEAKGWLDSSFKDPGHFLRLPYSLNERTGLVSLPIRLEEYDGFEPERAEIENVHIETWWLEVDDLHAKQEGMRSMLMEALGDDFL